MTAEQILTSHAPNDNTIFVAVNPATMSQETLISLSRISEPNGKAKELRGWLRACVADETNRRLIDGRYSDVPQESAAWVMPWHKWEDRQLSEALAASYSWFGMNLDSETVAVLDAVHRSIVCVCCCRLGELHDAIEMSRARG